MSQSADPNPFLGTHCISRARYDAVVFVVVGDVGIIVVDDSFHKLGFMRLLVLMLLLLLLILLLILILI